MRKNADGSGKLAAGNTRQNHKRRRSAPLSEQSESLSRVPKTERILNLIAFLLRSKKPAPVEQILSKVRGYDDQAQRDSLMRRFERDKKVLRDMGIPLQYNSLSQGLEGYFISQNDYYMGQVSLPAESQVLLNALANAAKRQSRGQIQEDLRSALLKLGFDSKPLSEEKHYESKAFCGEFLDLKLEGQEGDAVNKLSEAVLRRIPVRFTYYTIGRDSTSIREVDPYGLGFAGQAWHKGAWYLVGFCHLRKAVRVFKVQRIQGNVEFLKVEAGEDRFEFPEDFRLRDHIARPLWELDDLALPLRGQPGEDPAKARIKVAHSLLSQLKELVPAAQPVSEDASGAILELPVLRSRPFLRFLLSYSGHIEILEPPELKESLREFAREVLGLYENSEPNGQGAKQGE
ncbi:MAG: WYL domain-containing protein [Planctomycetota bacterium]|nr:WYL domain-containing protein [Planctomycetota bacterium]